MWSATPMHLSEGSLLWLLVLANITMLTAVGALQLMHVVYLVLNLCLGQHLELEILLLLLSVSAQLLLFHLFVFAVGAVSVLNKGA